MEAAPLFADITEGPDGGQAYWVESDDGVRLRVAAWEKGAPKGTVLLFPGRTEYVEKYGRTATDLAKRGYATLAIDWRGQGLADRLVDDAMAGHVLDFRDYQRDVAAMVRAAKELDLPKPWHLLAHSMGGCIALRAVIEGLPVQSCAFSAPMWGIQMSEALRPVAWSLSWSGRHFGMGHVVAPGTSPESYVLIEPFETNKLTNDRDMYQHMIDQTRAQPSLGLGGPSLRWLYEALKECRELSRLPSPDLPCLTFYGSDEQIVDVPRIHDRMDNWPGSQLEIVDGGKHELLMDNAEIRKRTIDAYCDVFDKAGQSPNDHAPQAAAGGQARQSRGSSRRLRSDTGAVFFPFLPRAVFRWRSHHRAEDSSCHSDKI